MGYDIKKEITVNKCVIIQELFEVNEWNYSLSRLQSISTILYSAFGSLKRHLNEFIKAWQKVIHINLLLILLVNAERNWSAAISKKAKYD